MGCCFSSEAGGGGGGGRLLGSGGGRYTPPTSAQRGQRWRATGMVALRGAKLKALPADVAAVGEAARTLDLAQNRLTTLGEAVSGMPQLTRLVLSDNLLEALPEAVGRLPQLKVLLVDGNRLTVLPPLSLPRLRELAVARNRLQALPPMGACEQLQKLDACHNELRSLPPSLGSCAQLQELDVSHNALSVLPTELAALQKLRVLRADANGIAAAGVPSEMLAQCALLHTLSLHDNPVRRDELEEVDGWAAMEKRRRARVQKQIDGGVLLDGVDDGVDRR